MLLAHPVVASVALDALVAINGSPPDLGIDIDRAHGADIRAVAARDTLARVDGHWLGSRWECCLSTLRRGQREWLRGRSVPTADRAVRISLILPSGPSGPASGTARKGAALRPKALTRPARRRFPDSAGWEPRPCRWRTAPG